MPVHGAGRHAHGQGASAFRLPATGARGRNEYRCLAGADAFARGSVALETTFEYNFDQSPVRVIRPGGELDYGSARTLVRKLTLAPSEYDYEYVTGARTTGNDDQDRLLRDGDCRPEAASGCQAKPEQHIARSHHRRGRAPKSPRGYSSTFSAIHPDQRAHHSARENHRELRQGCHGVAQRVFRVQPGKKLRRLKPPIKLSKCF